MAGTALGSFIAWRQGLALSWLAFATSSTIVACADAEGEDDATPADSTSPSTTTPSSPSAPASTGPTASPSQPTSSSPATGSTSAPGSSPGPSLGPNPEAGSGGAPQPGAGGAGGTESGASGAGGELAAGGQQAAGGEQNTGAGGGAQPGAGGSTEEPGAGGAGAPSDDAGVPTQGCTRQLLDETLDAYFDALAAQEPSSLPLAGNVKFTENGEQLELGTTGLWATAGEVVYSQRALDTELCQVAAHAVVPDGAMDIPVAVRLKLEAGEITEIETIAARAGDYSVASNTAALIASDAAVGWADPVPEADRATREQLTAWMDKYFRMFPSGVCNVSDDCIRLENGGGNYDCNLGATCTAGDPGPGDNALDSRLLLADVETGIGVGFTVFQNAYTDMHMFKMHGGPADAREVHAVHALLAEADGSGWD